MLYRLLLWAPIHELADRLRHIGLRDRLRCPECHRIGTFKPHGASYDRRVHNDRPVRRWLCKWCGLYLGPEGLQIAWPSGARGYWVLPMEADSDEEIEPTPQATLQEAYGRAVNPWGG